MFLQVLASFGDSRSLAVLAGSWDWTGYAVVEMAGLLGFVD